MAWQPHLVGQKKSALGNFEKGWYKRMAPWNPLIAIISCHSQNNTGHWRLAPTFSDEFRLQSGGGPKALALTLKFACEVPCQDRPGASDQKRPLANLHVLSV